MDRKKRLVVYAICCSMACSVSFFYQKSPVQADTSFEVSPSFMGRSDATLFRAPAVDAVCTPRPPQQCQEFVKCDHVFSSDFVRCMKRARVPSDPIAQIMRILKNDGVNCSGRYRVCVLFNAKENRVVSFRWNDGRGAQRAYYSYTRKGSCEKFYSRDGTLSEGCRSFVMPVSKVRVSSPFGMRFHPIDRVYKKHRGVDFSAPKGTKVFASSSGRIVHLGRLSGYGKCVRIRHDGGYTTTYAHLDAYTKNLRKGSVVVRGENIGRVGMTGSATAPHLHYEMCLGRAFLDPVLHTEKEIVLSGKEKQSFESRVSTVEKSYQSTTAPLA